MPRNCALPALVSLLSAPVALADSDAWVATPPSASMVVTVQLTITTALGTSSDTDTKIIPVTGSAHAVLSPTNPTWTGVTLDQVVIDPADASFHFDLYCFPFIGCQSIDVQMTNLVLTSLAPMSSAISSTGNASFVNAQFFMQGDYVATGVASGAGTLANPTTATFGCRITPQANQTVKLDQLTMSPIVTVVDPASLPAGVTALTITFTGNFTNTTMSGPWTPINPYDLTGDGLVNAADLSILLGEWGGPGSADFDANGSVNAADLSMLLAAWS